jgi:DNA polymerase I-like protein with 3'-5' exonuclease and polymerase domains
MSNFLDVFQSAEGQEGQIKKRAWMDSKKFVLGTVDNLAQIVDDCIASGRFSIDCETSGLDNRVFEGRTRDSLAGVCLSPDGGTGYYVPLGHVEVLTKFRKDEKTGEMLEVGKEIPRSCNIPRAIFDKEFLRLMAAVEAGKTIAIFHNAKFDQEFLQFNGGEPYGEWDSPLVWDDTMIMAALRNSRSRSLSLKDLSATSPDAVAGPEVSTGGPGLGMEMIELHELWGHDKQQKGFKYDFRVLDPSEEANLWYAGSDAICTFLLYLLLAETPGLLKPDDFNFQQSTIYKIEKLCLTSVRWMERNRIFIDQKVVLELIQLGQTEWMEAIKTVYEDASKILDRDIMPGYLRYLRDNFVSEPRCECEGKNPSCGGENGCGGSGYLTNRLIEAQTKAAHLGAKRDRNYEDPRGLHSDGKKEWPLIYDVNSAKQLGQMFEEMKVPGLRRTEKSGQIKTSKDEIDRVVEEAGKSFPFMGKVKRFREVQKALSSYLYAMLKDVDPDDNTIRIGFRQNKVDTGRFSTPAKEAQRAHIPGMPAINFQAIPRHDPRGKDRPVCMGRLREAIKPRKEKAQIAAIDYAGEELRLITNLSLEPKWLKEFFHCAECDRMFSPGDGKSTPEAPPAFCPNCGSDKIGDLHTLTALGVYGADARNKPEWKELRGNAKGLNFAMAYGGGPSAAQRSVGCSKQEGARIKHQYDANYPTLQRWWKSQHALAKRRGYVFTGFKRKYPVPDIHNPDGFFRSKAQRNSVNGPIQGSGADVIKIAMGLVYKECKKRGWLDKVKMIATMHDELVFEIDDDILEEAFLVLVPIMCRNPLILAQKWPVPLTCDVEFGDDWSVPHHLEKCKHRQNKGSDGEKVGFPPEIAPLFPKLVGAQQQGLVEAAHLFSKQAPEAASETPSETPSETAPEEAPSETTPEEAPSETVPEEAPSEGTEEPEAAPPPKVVEKPRPGKGDYCDFRLNVPLTVGAAYELAEAIHLSRGTGTQILRLFSNTGESLDEWLGIGNDGEPLYVNHHIFHAHVATRGLGS